MKNKAMPLISTITGILLFTTGLILIKTVADPRGLMLALPYVCVGVGCGLFGGGMGELIGRRVLKNRPDLQKQTEIEANDERNRAIADRAKAKAYEMMVFVYSALLIALALMGVDMTAIILLACAYMFVIGYGVWARCKLEKEM